MFAAVAFGFIVGFICLYLKATLKGTSGEGVWNFIHALLFQDITQTKSLQGLGIFYIVGQLFMRGLQMMIVPLVITSSKKLCTDTHSFSYGEEVR